jgi:Fe-S cluster assembly iron-binding protein IscA
LGKGKGA